MKTPTIRFLHVLAPAVLALGIGACAGEEPATRPTDCASFSMQTATWSDERSLQAGGDGLSERQHIADQLIECRSLEGASRSAVLKMLGEPDETASGGTLTYVVGDERGAIKIDAEYLNVYFEDGRVTDLKLRPG